MADVELLPLPEMAHFEHRYAGIPYRVRTAYTADQMHAYARANVEHHTAPLQAENERLRAELDRAIAELAGPEPTDGSAYYWACRVNGARRKAEARAERLAEALRPFAALYQPDDIGHMSNDNPDSQCIYGVNGKAITLGDLRRAAALAQEDRND